MEYIQERAIVKSEALLRDKRKGVCCMASAVDDERAIRAIRSAKRCKVHLSDVCVY